MNWKLSEIFNNWTRAEKNAIWVKEEQQHQDQEEETKNIKTEENQFKTKEKLS